MTADTITRSPLRWVIWGTVQAEEACLYTPNVFVVLLG